MKYVLEVFIHFSVAGVSVLFVHTIHVCISAYLCVHTQHCPLPLAEGYGIVNCRCINLRNLQCEQLIHPANLSMVKYIFDQNSIILIYQITILQRGFQDTDQYRKVLNSIFDLSFHHSFLIQNLKNGTPARVRHGCENKSQTSSPRPQDFKLNINYDGLSERSEASVSRADDGSQGPDAGHGPQPAPGQCTLCSKLM